MTEIYNVMTQTSRVCMIIQAFSLYNRIIYDMISILLNKVQKQDQIFYTN